MVQVIQLGTEIVDPALEPWKDFAGRWQNWRSRFNRHHWPESWQGQAYQADRLVFPSPWDDEDLITRFSLRQGLLFGYVLQQNKRRALLLPGYLGAGHELEAIYLIQEQVLLHFPCSLAGADWFMQVINALLPELLRMPAVLPELVQAPLQLRIEGHPNFAHCLLNTYTCLEELSQAQNLPIVEVVGNQPFGPMQQIFPEFQWRSIADLAQPVDQIFELPLSQRPDLINLSLRQRIRNYAAIQSSDMANLIIPELKQWKDAGGWILWVSLRTRGAHAVGLEDILIRWLKELVGFNQYPLLLLDGFSLQAGHTLDDRLYGASIAELIEEEKQQAEKISNIIKFADLPIRVIPAIGLPLVDSIALTAWVDFYFCHQGTIQHKIGWFQDSIPGVVHSNQVRTKTGPHSWGGLGGVNPEWLPRHFIATDHQAKARSSYSFQVEKWHDFFEWISSILGPLKQAPVQSLNVINQDKISQVHSDQLNFWVRSESIALQNLGANRVDLSGDNINNYYADIRHLFAQLDDLKAVRLDELAPYAQKILWPPDQQEPQIKCHSNVIYQRGSGCLYSQETGLAIGDSFLARFPGGIQACHCDQFRITLNDSSLPCISDAIYLPFATSENFGHFITETIGFLWPFLCDHPQLPSSIVLTNSPPEGLGRYLFDIVHRAGASVVMDCHLPERFMIQSVWVPGPSLRLHSLWSQTYLRAARYFGNLYAEADSPQVTASKIYVSRSRLGNNLRIIEGEDELQNILAQRGWRIFHPEQHPLPEQLSVYRQASCITGFVGSAFHALSLVSGENWKPMLILLGDDLTPDYLLQFAMQDLHGYFIYCTSLTDSHGMSPSHFAGRELRVGLQLLADLIEQLV
jgi:capsular polysaccharide biosynthesis protein